MRAAEATGVNAVPDLVFEETARRYQRRLPDGVRRRAILDQEMRQRDRRIEVDHRSSRSCCRSCMSCRSVMTGLRGGGPPPVSAGGVSHPSRTASASNASATNGLRPAWGGTISATTRSRSVTRTVSPLAARRTYSLSLFLSTFRPTERMPTKVATGSYLVNAPGLHDRRLPRCRPWAPSRKGVCVSTVSIVRGSDGGLTNPARADRIRGDNCCRGSDPGVIRYGGRC